MTFTIRALLVLQILGAIYGIYNEAAPAAWPLQTLPLGMGLALALIASSMAMTLLVLDHERASREASRQGSKLLDQLAGRVSLCLPTHEREFYALWAAQFASAQHNVDVTHLGPRPPQYRHGDEEKKYFTDMKRLCKASKAQVRRVERYTPAKLEWIRKLVTDFTGEKNFSLRVYVDESTDEMLRVLSVSRIDDKYAWIVAMAEHESTSSVRDLLVTGPAVNLVCRYFNERLWRKSIEVIERGNLSPDWEQEITR